VMTVYNAEETLGAAIDSILWQSYLNLELLIVDDCSSDGSLRVAKEKAAVDTRIRILKTYRNVGTYSAKNVGLRFARGEFVTFQDADDVSASHRIAMQANALDADSSSIANYTRYQRLASNGTEVWILGETNRAAYITLMVRRNASLKAVGYFDSVRVSADAEYVDRLRVASGLSVRLLPVVAYFALHETGSLTTSGPAAFESLPHEPMKIPMVRSRYADAARRWHERIYEKQSSAVMPFPLATRPFVASREILPVR